MSVVSDVAHEFAQLRMQFGNELFFFQYPFTVGCHADELGRELAGIIWNGEFRSCHVPAFLRWSCLAQLDWQVNFWEGFAAPILAPFCNVKADYFHNKVFNTEGFWFFDDFRHWCEETIFCGQSLYDHYTEGGRNSAFWRVRLIQDQLGLIQGDYLTENFFNGLVLWSLPTKDDQYFETRFCQLLNRLHVDHRERWRRRQGLMIDLGSNLARLAANISFPADGSNLSPDLVASQADQLAKFLNISDIMKRRFSSIYRFLNLCPPPGIEPINQPNIACLSQPFSGLVEFGGRHGPSLLGFRGEGPVDVRIENLNHELLGQVRFSLHAGQAEVPVMGRHCRGSDFQILGRNGTKETKAITGFDFWDQLRLHATVENHPAIRIKELDLRWSKPGLFRLARPGQANQFPRRLGKNKRLAATLGETMLLVPATKGQSPQILPNTAADCGTVGDGLFLLEISRQLGNIPGNSFTISSGQDLWEFAIVVPSASIRVAHGDQNKVVGQLVQREGNLGALVVNRNNLPDYEVSSRLPDGWHDIHEGQLGPDGSLVILKGQGQAGPEVVRHAISGLFSQDDTQDQGQPSARRITLGPLPAGIGSLITLAIEDGQGVRIGEGLVLKLADLGTRNPEMSRAVFRATSVELSPCAQFGMPPCHGGMHGNPRCGHH